MADPDVPDRLNRLWRLPTDTRLGRPAELDVERIVRAGVDIADTDGLAAVTLSRVAKSLGYTTMSLYRHVGSKDELYVLMGDVVTGTPPPLAAGEWRNSLRQWAHALRARYTERPWLAQLPVPDPPSGPNAIAWMDAGLRVLRGTTLDWDTQVRILTVLSGYVRNTTQLAAEMATGREGTGLVQEEVEQAYGRAMATLVDPDRFPDAAQLFRSGIWETPSDSVGEQTDDPDFAPGLELILDGVATAVNVA